MRKVCRTRGCVCADAIEEEDVQPAHAQQQSHLPAPGQELNSDHGATRSLSDGLTTPMLVSLQSSSRERITESGRRPATYGTQPGPTDAFVAPVGETGLTAVANKVRKERERGELSPAPAEGVVGRLVTEARARARLAHASRALKGQGNVIEVPSRQHPVAVRGTHAAAAAVQAGPAHQAVHLPALARKRAQRCKHRTKQVGSAFIRLKPG